MAYGARLESVLGASPRGFESPILRHFPRLKSTRVAATRCASRPVPSAKIGHTTIGAIAAGSTNASLAQPGGGAPALIWGTDEGTRIRRVHRGLGHLLGSA